jgi:hypothetical protein
MVTVTDMVTATVTDMVTVTVTVTVIHSLKKRNDGGPNEGA